MIETPDAPGATVVSALLNRAFLHVRREQWEQAVEDSIAVYYSAAALSEDRCHAALVASSIMVAVTGTRDEAIEMLTWVIQNAASNSRLQGDALATRAVLHAEAEHGQEADHDIDRLMQLAEEDPHFGEYMSSMFGDEDGVSP